MWWKPPCQWLFVNKILRAQDLQRFPQVGSWVPQVICLLFFSNGKVRFRYKSTTAQRGINLIFCKPETCLHEFWSLRVAVYIEALPTSCSHLISTNFPLMLVSPCKYRWNLRVNILFLSVNYPPIACYQHGLAKSRFRDSKNLGTQLGRVRIYTLVFLTNASLCRAA